MPPLKTYSEVRLSTQELSLLFLLMGLAVSCSSVYAQNGPYLEQAGQVVMEAENYDATISRNGKSWIARTDRAGFQGTAAMVAEPDTGTIINSAYATTSAELTYQVQFNNAGTYYIWVRGLPDDDGNNSVTFGLNGAEVSTADRMSTTLYGSWVWYQTRMDGPVASIAIPSAGLHTINVWMTEDGFRLDRILLTNSLSTSPTGAGPVESPRGAPDPRATVGEWSATRPWPYKAIHMHMLPTGKVLYYSSYENADDPQLWDPATETFVDATHAGYNIFCTGHAFLSDGRLFVSGGHVEDFVGLPNAFIYNPFTDSWSRQSDMNAGRWYPTTTALPNGDVLVVSGQTDLASGMNPMPQVWQTATGTWRNLTNALLSMPFYPYMFVAPNGKVFYAGPEQTTRYLTTSGTGSWSVVGNSNFGTRNWGSAVMYEAGKVLLLGGTIAAFYGQTGGELPTNTAEVIDLNAATPAWTYAAPMTRRRKHPNATILPDGRVLVTGGTSGSESTAEMSGDPAYESEVWDPASNTWTTWASLSIYRGYHATALLLPDGRILSASGDFGGPSYEIFSPPYFFRGQRPTITSAPASAGLGSTFFVQTPDATAITKVTLIALSSVTHGFSMTQRISYPTFSQATGGLNITTTSNANLLPPGYYMLFLLNGNGVPSVAKIVRIAAVTNVSAPTNLTAVAGTSSQINLAWTDNSNNEEGFMIERCQGSSCTDFSQIAQVGPGVTSYSNTGLSASTTYRYRVCAFSGGTNSSYTSTVNATTPAALVTGNGTGLKGEYYNKIDLTGSKKTRTDATVNFNWGTGQPDPAVSSDTFSVRWTGQAQPRFSGTYTFYTTSDDGVRLWVNGTQIINNWTDHLVTENSGTITLTANQKYDIVMEYYDNTAFAVATLSWSHASEPKQIIPRSQLYPTIASPAAPSNLNATTASTGQINLAWTENSDNETGFKIERCTGTGCTNFAQIATVGAGVTTFSNTGLSSSTTYVYRIRAYNSAGNSSYSNSDSARTN
jgi:PA14 domain/Domain of unknown function (DUF1929)/Gylcosyl hydrolase family 115 C-terminal domain/Fibronectin type III domain